MGKFSFLLVVILFLSILTACSDSPNSVKAPETSSALTTTEETMTTEEIPVI